MPLHCPATEELTGNRKDLATLLIAAGTDGGRGEEGGRGREGRKGRTREEKKKAALTNVERKRNAKKGERKEIVEKT